MEKIDIRAALFDLDGVVFDTEPQYTEFWGGQCRLYYPDEEGLEFRIKGQTLDKIFAMLFSGALEKEREVVTQRLNDFEANMRFEFVPGFEKFLEELHRKGVKTAVVTSSNIEKMKAVYKSHNGFTKMFDAILTSEDFEHSKPHPDCYQKAAARFGATADQCVVFEDSFNGLKSGRAAAMRVVGLTTTNPAKQIASLCDITIRDYTDFDFQKLLGLFQ